MADKKVTPLPPSLGAFELVIATILVLGVATTIAGWANKFFNLKASFFSMLPYDLINIFSRYAVFAFFLSIVLFFFVITYSIKERKIRKKIMSKVLPPERDVEKISENQNVENPKWKLVEEHINSEDANKWKLAILEADIIFGELLDSLNLLGESIGEKLKSVEKADFKHIEEAWEAHKIRNAIAHQGSDFLLTQREAKRVVSLYKIIFEEHKII